jgi:hypothetical protein
MSGFVGAQLECQSDKFAKSQEYDPTDDVSPSRPITCRAVIAGPIRREISSESISRPIGRGDAERKLCRPHDIIGDWSCH